MNRLLVRSLLAAVLAGASLTGTWAQKPITAKNPERRLPPTGSQSSDIPAGVDTGTPATSSALPLGTPVPPAAAADRGDQNKRSAAARAATRPGSDAVSSADRAAVVQESASPSLAPSQGRVPAGPAPLGAQTDPANQAATVPRSQQPAARKRTTTTSSATSRPDCSSAGTALADAPVAIPGTGFLGSSASPATASAVGRGTTATARC